MYCLTRYEPDELPGCSTPQKHQNTQLRFRCKDGLRECRYLCPTSHGITPREPLRLRDLAPFRAFQVPG
jgi:hypothetical protein